MIGIKQPKKKYFVHQLWHVMDPQFVDLETDSSLAAKTTWPRSHCFFPVDCTVFAPRLLYLKSGCLSIKLVTGKLQRAKLLTVKSEFCKQQFCYVITYGATWRHMVPLISFRPWSHSVSWTAPSCGGQPPRTTVRGWALPVVHWFTMVDNDGDGWWLISRLMMVNRWFVMIYLVLNSGK